jgi:two-component system, OmpR family, sensor histidine kinase KdpD
VVRFSTRRELSRYIFAVLLIAATTLLLWLLRDWLTAANFSVIYLLAVLIIAVTQGTGPSLLVALFSLLSFNYFLVKPYYTFLIADGRDVLDLVVYFACAALTGQLASYARKQADAARQRADEQKILYELTSTFNQSTDGERVREALRKVLLEIVSVRAVDILPTSDSPAVFDQTTLYLLLRTDDEIYGVLRVTFDRPPSPSLRQLIAACVTQASMVMQRIALSERAQRSKSFEEGDKLKTALLHAVSHDLRTPLTVIKTSASNLLNLHQTVAEAERVEMLKMIDHQADHLNTMVGDLLDISRLEAGALQIKHEWNSLEEVTGDVAAEVFARTKEERITIKFPDDMPLVSFDYGLIRQALSNLVENSLRYEPSNGCIEILGECDNSEARVCIRNHGPNIPIEERALIMEPFYHGKGGNIGLGLAIAKGIIEAHQGRIWVEDTPGGGATFVFALPLSKPPDDRHIE